MKNKRIQILKKKIWKIKLRKYTFAKLKLNSVYMLGTNIH